MISLTKNQEKAILSAHEELANAKKENESSQS